MRAAGYCRVSTVDQVDGGSLDHQEEAIRQECERHGWDLREVVREQVSTRKYQPARTELVNSLLIGELDVLIVARLDRFGRTTTDILNTISEVEKAGRRVAILHPPIPDTTDPYGRAMLTMLAAGAQLERDLIGLRTREGIAAKKAAGTYRGFDRPQCESYDQETIDAVLRWHRHDNSHAQVAALLEAQGFEPVRAEEWSASIVAGLVREHCGTCPRCVFFKRRQAGSGPVVPAEPGSASAQPESGPSDDPPPG